jgi:hypothetical protein
VKLTLPFRTTRDAANGLAEEAKQTTGELVRLPFNRFDEIDETTWWLSPKADNPAYKYGKIVCTHGNFDPEMFIGLYVEKGLDASTNTAGLNAKERRYRMDATWLWHDFRVALRSGEIDRVTTLVETQCGRPVVLAIDGGTDKEDWGFVRFEYRSSQLVPFASGATASSLAPLISAGSLAEIANLIDTKIPSVAWVWLDFHIGLTFAPDGDEEWDADTVWNRVCAPWASWLR